MPDIFNSFDINTPPRFTCPAVTIVIPLYNAEKYLVACLESILNQTFQFFEVIVVDDCSTDSSCAIVESYIPKFGGRLILLHMEKNSGSGAMPRNKGLALSRGEYIFFMDADDMLTKTALEELYTLAKNFDAEVVYCEKFFELNSATKTYKLISRQSGFVDKPMLDTENLAERIQGIMQGRYWVTPWCKLVRRNLMIEHEIFFPHVSISEDDIWTFGLVFYAKKFLRVPNVVYFYRSNEESVGQRKRTPEKKIIFWTNPILLGIKSLDNLMSKLDFFQKNPSYRYTLLEWFAMGRFISPRKDSWQMPPFKIYETIKKEFGDKFGEQDVLISLLCTYVMNLQKTNWMNIQKFNQFAAQAQQRIAQLEAELGKKT